MTELTIDTTYIQQRRQRIDVELTLPCIVLRIGWIVVEGSSFRSH